MFGRDFRLLRFFNIDVKILIGTYIKTKSPVRERKKNQFLLELKELPLKDENQETYQITER